MEKIYTIKEVSDILKFRVNSLKDPRFRARIGLRGVRIGKQSLRFLERDIKAILKPETPHQKNYRSEDLHDGQQDMKSK